MPEPLSQRDAELLLEIVEHAGPVDEAVSGIDRLARGGWLKAAENANRVICELCYEHHAVSVELDDRGRYGYHCVDVGWGEVSPEKLRRYLPDMDRLVRWVGSELELPSNRTPAELLHGQLWDLGALRIGSSRRMASLFVAAVGDVKRISDAMSPRLRGSPAAVILLSRETPPAHVTPRNITFCSLWECRRAGIEWFKIDGEIVAARVHGSRSAAARPEFSYVPDFSSVQVGNRTFRFGGSKQREVIGYLIKATEQGQQTTSVIAMLTDLAIGSNRLRDLFNRHDDWKDLIESRKGIARLRVDELLDEQDAEQRRSISHRRRES